MWLKEYYEVLGAATKKAQSYTDQEVSKVRTKFAVVASYADLPNPGRTDTIYLVPKSGFVSVYDQYIYENDQYTDIGDTELDLDSYATDLELSQGLATKVDKVEGYGLSKNDFTDAKDTKLANIEDGAQVNVTPDAALDKISTNAIQNKAVAEKFEEVEAEILNEDKVAEGNPITIKTGTAHAAKQTILTMLPIQSGSGTPAPDNIRPIIGRTQAGIIGRGKNLVKFQDIDTTVEGVTYLSNNNTMSIKRTSASTSDSSPWNVSVILQYDNMPWGPFPPGTYSIIVKDFIGTTINDRVIFYARYYDNSLIVQDQRISGESGQTADGSGKKYTFTATKPFKCGTWIRIPTASTIDCVARVQMERGTEITEIEPYVQGDSVTRNYGQTVYGGSDNVETGELTVEYMLKEFDGTEEITNVSSGANRFYRFVSNFGVETRANNIYGCSHFENAQVTTSTTYIGCDVYFSTTDQQSYIQFRPNISGVTDTDTFKAWLAAQYANGTPVQVFSKLRIPTTTTLTAAQVNLLKGLNNISTDADSIKMTYTINDFVTETEMNTALESKANVIDLNGKADLTSFGPYEAGPTASTNYAEGDYMIFDGKFCKASSAITAGDTLEIGTNLTETTIAAELLSIISQLPTT